MQEAVARVVRAAAIGAGYLRRLPVGGTDQGVDQWFHRQRV